MATNKPIIITLPLEVYNELKLLADKKYKSTNGYIRDMLIELLLNKEEKRPK